MNFNFINKSLEECNCEKCSHTHVCRYRGDVMALREEIKNLKELKEFISPVAAMVVCEEYIKEKEPALNNSFNINQPCLTNAYNYELAKGHKND